jgi:dethiobiotin synthetase
VTLPQAQDGARVVVVTGTDTGVGKTIATAALAVRAGAGTVVVKPAQTGVAGGEEGDASVVARLSGVPTQEWTTLADPLAPDTAARLRAVDIPRVSEYAERVRAAAAGNETVVVEGAGGLLVRLDTEGGTLLDLAAALAETHQVEVYVVCRAALGTLNHTELTVAALRARGIEPAGLVIGSWPESPDQAESVNRDELPRVTGVPVAAVLPERAGTLRREDFLAAAPTWFLPSKDR